MRIRTWADLNAAEKASIIEDLRLAVLAGRAAIDNIGGPPVVFNPRDNRTGWDTSEWRQLDEEARDTAGNAWFQIREGWPP